MKKKIIVTAIALIIVIVAVFSIATRHTSQKSETLTSGTLTIGLEGTYAPFSYRQNGKLTGFEVELSTKIAKKLGLKPKYVQTKWDSLIAGLGAKDMTSFLMMWVSQQNAKKTIVLVHHTFMLKPF